MSNRKIRPQCSNCRSFNITIQRRDAFAKGNGRMVSCLGAVVALVGLAIMISNPAIGGGLLLLACIGIVGGFVVPSAISEPGAFAICNGCRNVWDIPE